MIKKKICSTKDCNSPIWKGTKCKECCIKEYHLKQRNKKKK